MLTVNLDAEIDVVHDLSACIDDFYYNVDLKEMLPNRKYRTIGMILFYAALYIIFAANTLVQRYISYFLYKMKRRFEMDEIAEPAA